MRLALAALLCLGSFDLHAQGTTDIHVVTARGSAQELMDTADAVSILTQKQIHERMTGQTPDLLAGTTGVFLQHTSAGQGSPFIRGRTGKEILLLVNGMRFNTSTFRSGPNQYYGSIDPHSVERIEVIRGPSSVLYGSDAMGGVINVILKQPQFDDFDFSFGTRGRFESASSRKEGNLFGEVSSSSFGALANATYADIDNVVGGSSIGRQPFTSYEEWGVSGAVGFRTGKHTFSLSYNHFQQNDVNRTDAVSGIMPNQSVLPAPGVGSDLRRLFVWQIDDFLAMGWRVAAAGTLEELTVNVNYHKQQESLQRIRRSSPNRLEDGNFNTHSLGAKAQAVLALDAVWARLTVGLEAIHDMVHSRSVDINRQTQAQTNHRARAQFPDWSSYTTLGVFAQNETSLVEDKLQLRYGLRYSMYRALADVDERFPQLAGVNNVYTDLTYALAVVGRPIDEIALTLNLARGFRAPNLDDLAASKAFGSGAQFPNPDVEPETQWSADLGARVLLPNKNRTSAAPYNFMAHVVFYFNYLDNTLTNQPATLDGVNGFRQENAGRARIFGVEAETGLYFSEVLGWLGMPTDRVFMEGDALGVHANFAWTRGDDLKNEAPLNRIPPAYSELSVRYEVARGAAYIQPFITIVGRQDQYGAQAATDARFTPHDSPGYVLFGLRGGWTPSTHMRFNLSIHNLGNRSYHPIGSGVYGAGTNVVLSAELRW